MHRGYGRVAARNHRASVVAPLDIARFDNSCRSCHRFDMAQHPTRPRDLNQRAFQIVQATTGGPQLRPDPHEGKNAAAVALGRKGGTARAQNISKERRTEIARNAANVRWKRIN